MKDPEVIVLDSERRFLEYTHPAIARKLLKDGQAIVYSKSPFAIQLNKSVTNPNRVKRNEEIMGHIINFTDFFKEEKDIYVQNVSNCQVSVSFEVAPGRSESYLFTNSKDPVNLTRFIPFHAIKSSMDLRRMLNRVPPALQLLTETEHDAYYSKSARDQGLKSADEAMAKAEARRMAVQNHQPLPDAPDPIKIHEVVEDGQRLGEKKLVKSTAASVSEADEINPRVLNLCLQVHPSIPDQQKMTAQQMLAELDTMDSLAMLDWEYLQSHGYYKSVRNLARKKVAELASASVEPDEEEEVKPVKKAKKQAKTSVAVE